MESAQAGRAHHQDARDGACARVHEGLDQGNDLQRLAEARLVGEDPTAALVGAKEPPHALLLMRL